MSSAPFYQALQSAPDRAACTKLFLAAMAPYGMTAFACGEVDLEHKERTVYFAISWPGSWQRIYREAGLVDRDPVVSSLPRYGQPFFLVGSAPRSSVVADGQRSAGGDR
jgi:Autoinducer binding domain